MAIGSKASGRAGKAAFGSGAQPFVGCFGGLAAAGFVGTADVEPGNAGFSGPVLVDEVDPKGWHLRKAHRVGVAAFLRPREKAPHLVLEGAALGQKPLVGRRAAADVGPQPYVEHSSHGFQVGSLDQLLYPSEIVHQPAPRLIEVARPQADTEEGKPKELSGLFPQPNLEEIATVAAPGEVGGTRHVGSLSGGGWRETSGWDVTPSNPLLQSGQHTGKSQDFASIWTW
jgi:hypothetical protein